MKWLSMTVAMSVGFIVLLDYFFELEMLNALGTTFRQWAIILTAFALLVGLGNLLFVHLARIFRRQEPGMLYSAIVLITAFVVFFIGLIAAINNEPSNDNPMNNVPMNWIFDNLYLPLQSAFSALAAFFLATAAYRALRARNFETLVMLISALVVFLGQMPLDSTLVGAKEWVLSIPSTAGVRGILLGVALGTIATGIRLLIGMDRPYSE